MQNHQFSFTDCVTAMLLQLSFNQALWNENYTVSRKTGPLLLVWHNFINLQHLLIIFGRDRPHSILSWCNKKLLNWLRISCVVAITTVATWHTGTANFWADFEQRLVDRVMNRWQNDCEPLSRMKDCTSDACCNLWQCTLFRQKHCLFKKLTFLFITQHKL